jgi:hypothetical protein
LDNIFVCALQTNFFPLGTEELISSYALFLGLGLVYGV